MRERKRGQNMRVHHKKERERMKKGLQRRGAGKNVKVAQ
jgi:hypothetical protein